MDSGLSVLFGREVASLGVRETWNSSLIPPALPLISNPLSDFAS